MRINNRAIFSLALVLAIGVSHQSASEQSLQSQLEDFADVASLLKTDLSMDAVKHESVSKTYSELFCDEVYEFLTKRDEVVIISATLKLLYKYERKSDSKDEFDVQHETDYKAKINELLTLLDLRQFVLNNDSIYKLGSINAEIFLYNCLFHLGDIRVLGGSMRVHFSHPTGEFHLVLYVPVMRPVKTSVNVDKAGAKQIAIDYLNKSTLFPYGLEFRDMQLVIARPTNWTELESGGVFEMENLKLKCETELCWIVRFSGDDGQDHFQVNVSAQDGQILGGFF